MNTTKPILLIALLSASGSALAHHSFVASYDPSRPMEMTGVVAEYVLKSPHSLVLMDVETDSGELQRYEVEMASLPMMRRRGFDADSFKPGDEITIVAWPHRTSELPLVWGAGIVREDEAAIVSGEHVALADAQSQHQAATGLARLEGRWLAPFPTVGRQSPLPLSPAGIAARDNYDPTKSPANTCEPNNVPAVFHSPYLFEIQITAQEAIIRHEAYNITRTVPLSNESRQAEPTGVFGLAIGRLIDGETLLIESSGFPPSRWGLGVAGTTNGAGADVPSSAQKRVLERYSASGDGNTLTVAYTLEDAIYLTEPYSNSVQLTRVADDSPMYEYACEPENASRFSRER